MGATSPYPRLPHLIPHLLTHPRSPYLIKIVTPRHSTSPYHIPGHPTPPCDHISPHLMKTLTQVTPPQTTFPHSGSHHLNPPQVMTTSPNSPHPNPGHPTNLKGIRSISHGNEIVFHGIRSLCDGNDIGSHGNEIM